jgi:hypothetical protein
MKTVGLFLLVLGLGGCGRHPETPSNEHASHHHTGAEPEGITFSAKHGLSVPAETAKHIGLKIVDVEEKRVASTVRFSAQLYEISGEKTLASGVVSEERASLLTPNAEVQARVGESTTSGKILAIRRPLGGDQGLIEVTVELANVPPGLSVGSFVSVEAPISAGGNALSIPRTALLKTVEGMFAYTVSGNFFVRTPVKVGAVEEAWVEVQDGLLLGDRVVQEPVLLLWLAELQTIRGGESCAHGH